MFVLVAYDVSSTQRRNKVVKILSNYDGCRVNLSVFECELKKSDTLIASLLSRLLEVTS